MKSPLNIDTRKKFLQNTTFFSFIKSKKGFSVLLLLFSCIGLMAQNKEKDDPIPYPNARMESALPAFQEPSGVKLFQKAESLTTGKRMGARPLFLVNGKEIDEELWESVNTAKIKSIEVLKAPAAQERYGLKGKNGAVIIKAKRNYLKRNKL